MKRKTTVGHAKHDDCDAYIGRKDKGRKTIQNTPPGDCFGNPYRVDNYSRGASIRKFADLLDTLLEERPIYRLYVRDLAGKTIGCWCRRVNEGEPACHGDVLAAKADHLYEQLSTAEGETCERGDHWLVDYRQWRECVWCGTSAQDLSHGRAIDRTGADLWPDDDGDDGKAHRVSDVSNEDAESSETGDSDSDRSGKGGSDETNLGFETQKSDAKGRRGPTRAGVPPSDHFITEACVEAYHKLGKINSAEGESHLPAGGSQPNRTCFFPAQDNIVCHSPSDCYGLLSSTTARATNTLGHDGGPGRQRWNDGAHP